MTNSFFVENRNHEGNSFPGMKVSTFSLYCKQNLLFTFRLYFHGDYSHFWIPSDGVQLYSGLYIVIFLVFISCRVGSVQTVQKFYAFLNTFWIPIRVKKILAL